MTLLRAELVRRARKPTTPIQHNDKRQRHNPTKCRSSDNKAVFLQAYQSAFGDDLNTFNTGPGAHHPGQLGPGSSDATEQLPFRNSLQVTSSELLALSVSSSSPGPSVYLHVHLRIIEISII